MKIAFGIIGIKKEIYQPIINVLEEKNFSVIEVTSHSHNLHVNKKIVTLLQDKSVDLAVILENNSGVASFMYCTKFPDIIAANCTDEESATMTRRHNDTNLMIVPLDIVGPNLAQELIVDFFSNNYDGGRHQVRIDMLKTLLEG